MDSPYDIEAMAKRQNPIDWHGRYLAEKARAETAEAALVRCGNNYRFLGQQYDAANTKFAETQAVVREVVESLCADDSGWERDPKVAQLRAVLPEAMESR